MEQATREPALLARIEELETRVAFQEHTLSELNETIAALSAYLARLETSQRELLTRLRAHGDPEAPSNVAEERPPHY